MPLRPSGRHFWPSSRQTCGRALTGCARFRSCFRSQVATLLLAFSAFPFAVPHCRPPSPVMRSRGTRTYRHGVQAPRVWDFLGAVWRRPWLWQSAHSWRQEASCPVSRSTASASLLQHVDDQCRPTSDELARAAGWQVRRAEGRIRVDNCRTSALEPESACDTENKKQRRRDTRGRDVCRDLRAIHEHCTSRDTRATFTKGSDCVLNPV
jgi:hypothetical protein